jgi:hypothetical protein
MANKVLKITCDNAACREATGGFDYFVTEGADWWAYEVDFCRRCDTGETRIVGELNEYAKGYHASIGTQGVLV